MKNTPKEITNSMQMKHATESLITNEKKIILQLHKQRRLTIKVTFDIRAEH